MGRVEWQRILHQAARRLSTSLAAGDPATGRWLLVAVALAAACILVPPAWRLVRPVVTLTHELGHGLVGLLCGRRFAGFVISPDMSGHTVTVGRRTGPGAVLVILIAVLVQVRSLFTVAWVLALIAADGFLWWTGATRWSAAAVAWLGTILLVGAWRHLAAVALHGDRNQDPGALARLTRVPAPIWVILLTIPVLACTWWAWTCLSAPLRFALDGPGR